MHLYPDGGTFYLKRDLSAKLGVDTSQLLVTHGSNEAIELLGHVFLGPGTEIVMSQQAFIIYRLVADLFEAATVATPAKDFTHDLPAMLDAITPRTRLVFIANPNNPTGTRVTAEVLDRFVNAVPDHVITVIDEAYIELLPESEQPPSISYVLANRNVVILRTFSKTYGLAGLRIGYLIAPPDAIDLLNRARQPFNVSAMAQLAAGAALRDDAFVAMSRKLVADGLAQLERGLAEAGIEWVPSVVNFLLVKVGKGRACSEALQRRHIIVRPMDGYGLPEYIRITIGTREQNERFLCSLREVLAEVAA
jgi:histidinol-phosphate aminotransferase